MKYYIIDFDGTITLEDTLVKVFDKYCVSDWMIPEKKMLNGEITRIKALFEEVDLMNVPYEELYDFLLNNIKIRNEFSEFVESATERGDKIIILSGGFRSFIEFLLTRYCSQFTFHIVANDIKFMGNGKWQFVPCPDTLPQLCSNCPNCKKAQVLKIKDESNKTVYVGDGETDFCASVYADEIIACGELAKRLQKNGIKYTSLIDFSDLI